MNSFKERKQQRINRDVQQQARYVTGVVLEKIDAGQESPYVAYARVKGLTPEDTARNVGHAVIGQLGEQFMLDAKVAEEESSLVREGAVVSVIRAGGRTAF